MPPPNRETPRDDSPQAGQIVEDAFNPVISRSSTPPIAQTESRNVVCAGPHPAPYLKEIRPNGFAGEQHVLSQVGTRALLTASKSKSPSVARGREMRSCRNVIRYTDLEAKSRDAAGLSTEFPVCHRVFDSGNSAKKHYGRDTY